MAPGTSILTGMSSLGRCMACSFVWWCGVVDGSVRRSDGPAAERGEAVQRPAPGRGSVSSLNVSPSRISGASAARANWSTASTTGRRQLERGPCSARGPSRGPRRRTPRTGRTPTPGMSPTGVGIIRSMAPGDRTASSRSSRIFRHSAAGTCPSFSSGHGHRWLLAAEQCGEGPAEHDEVVQGRRVRRTSHMASARPAAMVRSDPSRMRWSVGCTPVARSAPRSRPPSVVPGRRRAHSGRRDNRCHDVTRAFGHRRVRTTDGGQDMEVAEEIEGPRSALDRGDWQRALDQLDQLDEGTGDLDLDLADGSSCGPKPSTASATSRRRCRHGRTCTLC